MPDKAWTYSEDDAENALTAGESPAAIESVLDAACGHLKLMRLSPVRKMANDHECIDLEPFKKYLNT